MASRPVKKASAKKPAPTRAATKKTAAKKTLVTKPTAKRPAKRRAKRAAKSRDSLGRLREICLSLPEAHEVEAWGEPTFRVRNKLFAMHSSAGTHHGAGRQGVWIASTRVTQDLVLRARPDRYFSPPYVGPSGWIGAWLDRNPLWSEIIELLRDAYRLKAPKRLAATIGE